jgi:RHS repeat-associated protein
MHDSILAGNIWGSAGGAPSPRRGTGAAWGCTAQGSRTPAWRSDVLVILTEGGSIVELIKYTPYGEPIALPAGDVNGDFAFDDDDEAIITDYIENGGTYDVRYDTMLTGRVGTDDIAHAHSIAGGYQSLGRGVLSSEGVRNRFGYAGYRYDHHLAGAGRHPYHVRHRVYQAHVGRFASRDPNEYDDGMNLYQYVRGLALIATDPWGLDTAIGTGGRCFSGFCGGSIGGRTPVAGDPMERATSHHFGFVWWWWPPQPGPGLAPCQEDCKREYPDDKTKRDGCNRGCWCAALGADCNACCGKNEFCRLACFVYRDYPNMGCVDPRNRGPVDGEPPLQSQPGDGYVPVF